MGLRIRDVSTYESRDGQHENNLGTASFSNFEIMLANSLRMEVEATYFVTAPLFFSD